MHLEVCEISDRNLFKSTLNEKYDFVISTVFVQTLFKTLL